MHWCWYVCSGKPQSKDAHKECLCYSVTSGKHKVRWKPSKNIYMAHYNIQKVGVNMPINVMWCITKIKGLRGKPLYSWYRKEVSYQNFVHHKKSRVSIEFNMDPCMNDGWELIRPWEKKTKIPKSFWIDQVRTIIYENGFLTITILY